ncbi:MAG: LysR family transcriptional regulator [Clostridia bacterium]|nr:LysR family transcriptional regulator [Clostridia bacterium]
MDFQQLKYFKAVATVGKIAEAAEALFVSAPALSMSIARLEKELGVRLFDRAGNRITLNEQGKIFLKYTSQIFTNLNTAKQELQQSLLRQSPCISLLSINSMIWVELITAFTSEFPEYTMAHTAVSIATLTANGLPAHCNLLLAYESEIPLAFNDELDSVALFKAKPVVMLHKDHPLAAEKEIDISMLANEKFLMSHPGQSLHSRIKQLFELRGLPFPSDTFYSYVARQKMVSENLGISFASQSFSNLLSSNVRYIPLVDPFEPWTARLYWRKDHPLTEQEEAFQTFVKQFYDNLH